MIKLITLITFTFSATVFAAPAKTAPVKTISDEESMDRPLSPSTWEDVHQTLDTIRDQNLDRTVKMALRTGFTQIQTNVADAVDLGTSLPSLGLDGTVKIYKGFEFEGSYLHAQNLAPLPSSPNKASAYMTWIYAGPRYTFHFDSTQIDDTLSIKLLYHSHENNFELTNASNRIFMSRYTSIAPGAERSIPLTGKIDVLASFYLIQILTASSSSAFGFKQQGYGFKFSGELTYKLEWFRNRTRLGLNYIQSGYENEFDQTTKDQYAKNSYFQLSRSLLITFTGIF